MKKQFVYIGQYYHIKGKQIPLDYKFGVTDSLDMREYQLSRTKSPIKYMILRAWEIPVSVKRESVERLIKWLFREENYKSTEWYDVDGDIFQDQITEFFNLLTDMIPNDDFKFIEVNLDFTTPKSIEEKTEQEIRKKSLSKNMICTLDDGSVIINKDHGGAAQTFVDTIRYLRKYIDLEILIKDFPRICGKDSDAFSQLKLNSAQLKEVDDMVINTCWSTASKSKHLNDMFNKYKKNINIELFVNS